MNYLDYIVLGILALFVIRGYLKGFIIGLATIAALLLGIFIAVHFSKYLDTTLMEHLHPSRKWLPVISFAITFILVVLLVIVTAKLTEKLVDLAGMGFFNRLGGALLGLAKGVILISLLAYFIQSVDPKSRLVPEKTRKDSFLYGRVEEIFPKMMKMFGGKIGFSN